MCIRIPCGYSFQTISTIIAYLEILLASTSLLALTIFGTIALTSPIYLDSVAQKQSNVLGFNEIHSFLQAQVSTQAATLTLFSLYFICGISLGILLLSGTQRRQVKKLRVWFLVQSLCYVIRIFVFVAWLYVAHPDRRADVGLCSILLNLYAAFSLTTVKYFLDEVKCESLCHRGMNKGLC